MTPDESNNNRKDHEHCFDFEIGYLIKSPCRECIHRERLPLCVESCQTLARIHEKLARVISCSSRHSG
ncbi:hypothetical protein [Desulfatirhabdium butyrativorans]|uniref:hypothetical protein n=1 Tax=Desulfatirhabdium butyrativorans TaxID=340467 RepID=UPI00042738A5|nr:hypothetical protein [Desulfatirhabdium butyrativorans]